MLEFAVAVIHTDKAAALEAIAASVEGVQDRDLLVFCSGSLPGEVKMALRIIHVVRY